MADKSSYVKYLPAVLWENDPPPPQFSLGSTLRLFEKFLTGIDDGVTIMHGAHEHDPIQDVIARTFRLYQPWATPPTFLDWLAQWVSLQFSPVWDEYQRRKITSQIVGIYALRGLKDGLDTYLDLYAVADRRPRTVIDDANKILFSDPAPAMFASIFTLVSQMPLLAPHGLALGPDENIFVADVGNNLGLHQVNPGVWRLSPSGQYDYAGPSVHAQPLGPPAFNPVAPAAVATDNTVPYGLYILDGGLTWTLYRLVSPTFNNINPLFASALQLGVKWGIAMTVGVTGNPLILDRGALPASPSATGIVEVQVVGSPPVFSGTVVHPINLVVEPLSMVLRQNGTIVVGDGRDQANPVPADLILVDPGAGWTATSLLGGVPAAQNPLVAPTGIVEEDSTHLIVMDAGLKPFIPDAFTPFNSKIAQQAALYRVDLSQAPPTITRASEERQIVYSRGMIRGSDGMVHVCDSGLPDIAGYASRQWRSVPQQFAVVVHFGGPPAVTPAEKQARNKFLQSIRDVIAEEKPAQTNWVVQSEV